MKCVCTLIAYIFADSYHEFRDQTTVVLDPWS